MQKRKGFTLVEILVVVLLLAILATILVSLVARHRHPEPPFGKKEVLRSGSISINRNESKTILVTRSGSKVKVYWDQARIPYQIRVRIYDKRYTDRGYWENQFYPAVNSRYFRLGLGKREVWLYSFTKEGKVVVYSHHTFVLRHRKAV